MGDQDHCGIIKKATGVAWGAVTIINAIPTGIGCAFGVDIPVRSRIRLKAHPVEKRFDPLIEACIKSFLMKTRGCRGSDIDVEVDSSIPPAMGLKSSSAVSNATCLGLNALLEAGMDKMECIHAGVDASMRSGVTITGAFDDACASMFGRAYLTDNNRRVIISEYHIPDWRVIIFIPEDASPRPKSGIDIEPFVRMKDQYMEAVRHARRGELVQAMRINGLITAGILGDDTELIKKVNDMGALAGGTTGTGPAQAFIFDDRGSLIRAGRFLEKRGRVIYTGPAEKEGYAMVV